MSQHQPLPQILAACKGVQQVFWSSAAAAPMGPDHEVFLGADWPEPQPTTGSWADAARVTGVFQRLNARTWLRIAAAFDAWRASLGPDAARVPWEAHRARWFAIAEAEFLRTQRSEPFLAALADAVALAARVLTSMQPEGRLALERMLKGAALARRAVVSQALAGVEIANTPKHEIWRSGQISVSRYTPLNGITRLGPVLICHGLIGRQTMTDLLPERSIVRQLLAAGCDVYVLDWGDAGPNEADLGTTTITQSVLPGALDQVLAASGADRAVLMGICQGGTLAAIHAALDPSRLAGLITAVAPFDFTADEHDSDPAHGLLHLWTRAPAEADLSAVLEASGNLPGDLMGLIFDQLNPAGTLAKYAVKLTESGDNPEELRLFLAMEAWLADRPDLPATLAKEWLIGLYRQNQLADGAVKVGGKTVDLSELQLPVLNIMAANDHIVPPPCSRALRRLAPAAQYQELTVPAGHIGAFVSSRAQAVMGPEIIGWLRELRNQRFTTR